MSQLKDLKRTPMRTLAWCFLAVLIYIQWLPDPKTCDRRDGVIPASFEVKDILKKACYDCHSSHPQWTWKEEIAPYSWFTHSYVQRSQEVLNFETWNHYTEAEKNEFFRLMERDLNRQTMPPQEYLESHPGAALSTSEMSQIRNWIQSRGH